MFLKWKLIIQILQCMVKVMVFNATFNNNSVILWWSVLFVGETGENTDLSQVTDKPISHNVVSSIPRLSGI